MSKPVFYDSDCLECFLRVDAAYILEKMFDRIVVPEQVYNEVMFENTPSYIKENFSKLRDGFVEIYEFEFGSSQFSAYRNIKKRILEY